jgi:hypothetical protein
MGCVDDPWELATERHSKRAATRSSSRDGRRTSRRIRSGPSATSPAARPQSPWPKRSCGLWCGDVRDAVKMLHKSDPALKADVYAGLGLRFEYRPESRVVAVELPLESACATARVGGGVWFHRIVDTADRACRGP